MTTTISDTLYDPTSAAVAGVTVRASLVAASEVLAAGGAIVREAETTTAVDGTWSLALTPIDSLAVPTGAYYLITADGHRWTIDVPDSGGPYKLHDVEVEPAPLPATGATAVSVAVRPTVELWGGAAYAAVSGAKLYIGGPADPMTNDGDMWLDTVSSPARVMARIGGASVEVAHA